MFFRKKQDQSQKRSLLSFFMSQSDVGEGEGLGAPPRPPQRPRITGRKIRPHVLPSEEERRTLSVSETTPEKYFYLYGGYSLKSVPELLRALEVMDDEQFTHHVFGERNDFASWVADVFDEHELSDRLRRVRSKEEAGEVIRRFLS